MTNQKHTSTATLATPVLLGLVSLALLSCTPTAPEPENQPHATQSPETMKYATPVTGEVPQELMDAIFKDLIEKENVERQSISVNRAESVIWPDGSLGCAQPGEMYTMATVQGYWVVLQSGGKEFDYRASAGGHFFLCRNRLRIQNPVG